MSKKTVKYNRSIKNTKNRKKTKNQKGSGVNNSNSNDNQIMDKYITFFPDTRIIL